MKEGNSKGNKFFLIMELQKYLVIVKSYKYQDIAFLKALKFVHKICALFGAIYHKWDFLNMLLYCVLLRFVCFVTSPQKSKKACIYTSGFAI